MADLDEHARRLYAAPPDGFVAARADAVDQAKRAGDAALARQLAALRKPTVAAWLVNLLALREPGLLADLAELSTALRQAQRGLEGSQLRALTEQRRQVVSALVAAARRLAVEADGGLRTVKLPLSEVESTLTAALAEPEVAAQVRSGRLVKAVSYAGFGEVPKPRLRLVTEEPPPAAPRRADREKRRRLERELHEAERAAAAARSAVDKASAAESDALHAIDEIEDEIAALEERRGAAQAEASRRKLARRAAEREASAARRRAGDLAAALEDIDTPDDRFS